MNFDIKKFEWTREPEIYSITDNRIEITTKPFTDLWQRTYYHFRNDNAPLLQMHTDERFFSGEKRLKDFYRSFLGIPVAGATLPVIAFFLLGIYGRVIWLMISVVVFGIGHIGIHLQHYNELK